MAAYYVWSGATGSANGTSWANAYTTLATAFTGKVAGDTFYVAHDHAESSTSVTLRGPGTSTAPIKIVCVNRAGSVPPVSADRRATAQVITTANNNLAIYGWSHYDGVIFSAGTGSSSSANIFLTDTDYQWLRFDNCSFRFPITGSSGGALWAGSSVTAGGTYIELNNTTMSFAAGNPTTPAILLNGTMKWRNTPTALLTFNNTAGLVTHNASARGAQLECVGVDLSAIPAAVSLVNFSNGNGQGSRATFLDCKLNASAIRAKPRVAVTPYVEIDFYRSGASGVNYNVYSWRIGGDLSEETTIVRTGGAVDGTTPLSWKVVTAAAGFCNFSFPFECPPIVFRVTAGTPVTATVEGVWGAGVVPNDDECWVDVEYLGDASSPQGSFVNDGKADLLTAASPQTSSTATWASPGAVTWEPATVTAVTLSGGNLVATSTGTTSVDQGAHVAAAFGQGSGKYYFEATLTAFTGGVNVGVGVGTPASTYTGMGNGGTTGVQHYRTGSAYSNGSSLMGISGNYLTGQTMMIAVDLDNRRIWFYKDGLWNQNAANNPATNVGGLVIPAGTMVPFVTFGGSAGAINNVVTANFGASAFVGAVPAGFTSGWAASGARFKLAVTFTPQQSGLAYARVKCAKPATTFYLDPLVVVS